MRGHLQNKLPDTEGPHWRRGMLWRGRDEVLILVALQNIVGHRHDGKTVDAAQVEHLRGQSSASVGQDTLRRYSILLEESHLIVGQMVDAQE